MDALQSTAAKKQPPSKVIALIAIATVLSSLVWIWHAQRFFTFTPESYGSFWNRRFWMLLHVAGGTVPLFTGPVLIWSGLNRWRPQAHRWIGRLYLGFGAVGIGGGAILSVIAAESPRTLYVATFTLSLAWLAAAAMAFRAILNHRIAAHREWVIRSYVLTLTFVGCRLAMRLPMLADLGPEAITATIWVSWVTPVLITEVLLQWKRTGPVEQRARVPVRNSDRQMRNRDREQV